MFWYNFFSFVLTAEIIRLIWLIFALFAAVQQERKPPPEKDIRQPMAVSTSTQKIYIRKDFTSNSASVPVFSPKVNIYVINHHFYMYHSRQIVSPNSL